MVTRQILVLKSPSSNLGRSTNIIVMRKGNKQNALLNGEWAKHMRRWGKFFTAKIRRNVDKKVIREEVKNEL